MQSPRVVDSTLLIYVYLITSLSAREGTEVMVCNLDPLVLMMGWYNMIGKLDRGYDHLQRIYTGRRAYLLFFFFWSPFLHACSWPRWFLDSTSISIIGLVSPKYQVVLAHHNPSRLRTTFPLKLSRALNTHQKRICLLKTPLVSTRTVTLKSYIDDVFIYRLS